MLLPEWYVLSVVFVFGAVIGSFLNVVIYRFHTGKSLNGSSHCLSCGTSLEWYELFPVVSYIVLRGRCRSCSSYIPARYLVVELVTALSFLAAYELATSWLTLLVWFVLIALLVVVIVYDLYHFIIPNELVLAIAATAVVVVAVAMFPATVYQGLYIILQVLLVGGFYAGLWFISKGRWIGLGDAKLAAALAIMLTPLGAVSLVLFSFWLGAGVSIVILLFQRIWFWLHYWYRRLCAGTIMVKPSQSITMKSEIPFAPFIIAAFVLVYWSSMSAVALTEHVLTYFFNLA